MFLKEQIKEHTDNYYSLLQSVGSLSKLFSDSNIPYLYYRSAENIFCISFEADNLSRSDCSADARKMDIGIGLKTFLNGNGKTFQKVAEFNKDRRFYSDKIKAKDLAINISELRNKRIQSTKAIHGIYNMVYHCVTRSKNVFHIYEENMDEIDLKKIRITGGSHNSIYFNDCKHDYIFNSSKSTLFKRFVTQKESINLDIVILEDPFTFIKEHRIVKESISIDQKKPEFESIILPLYSTRGGYIQVQEKSGLNQWNAGGRARADREVYIPIPKWIHEHFPDFFPGRDISFKLNLPNRKVILAKVCQENSKALMSNPNKDLGVWLLDDVLKVPPGEVVTYEHLQDVGIDSVEVTKISNEEYAIDFKKIGSFENFFNSINEEDDG